MSVLVLLILASLALAAGFLMAFIWAVRSGQFEDTSTPPMRLLLEEPDLPPRDRSSTTPERENS